MASSGQPLRKPVFVKVDSLRPGTSGHNLTVKVGGALTLEWNGGGGAAPARSREQELSPSFTKSSSPSPPLLPPLGRQVAEVKLVVNRQRADGSTLRIAECIVGDDTGCVVFTARGNQGVACRTDRLRRGESRFLPPPLLCSPCYPTSPTLPPPYPRIPPISRPPSFPPFLPLVDAIPRAGGAVSSPRHSPLI